MHAHFKIIIKIAAERDNLQQTVAHLNGLIADGKANINTVPNKMNAENLPAKKEFKKLFSDAEIEIVKSAIVSLLHDLKISCSIWIITIITLQARKKKFKEQLKNAELKLKNIKVAILNMTNTETLKKLSACEEEKKVISDDLETAKVSAISYIHCTEI